MGSPVTCGVQCKILGRSALGANNNVHLHIFSLSQKALSSFDLILACLLTGTMHMIAICRNIGGNLVLLLVQLPSFPYFPTELNIMDGWKTQVKAHG